MTLLPSRGLWAGLMVSLTLSWLMPTALANTEDEIHVLLERGEREMQDGDFLLARRAFRLVLDRDDENLDAYDGLARAALAIEEWNDGFEAVSDALELVQRDKAQQRRFKALQIALETGEANFGWYLRAYNIYHRHLQEDPKAWSDSNFALAIARSSLEGFKREEDGRYLDEAVRYLRRAVSSGGPAGGEASTLLAQVEKVHRASIGNPAIAKIALANTLTRIDLVALIYRHMKLVKLLPPATQPSRRADETADDGSNDYAGNPLADNIRDLHRRNVRGIYIEDGKFRPKDSVSREEFALLLEDMIVEKAGDKRLARNFIGSHSPFGDLNGSRASFNAFMTATSRGLLHPDSEGNIRPTQPVSGADAILALRTLSGKELVQAN